MTKIKQFKDFWINRICSGLDNITYSCKEAGRHTPAFILAFCLSTLFWGSVALIFFILNRILRIIGGYFYEL